MFRESAVLVEGSPVALAEKIVAPEHIRTQEEVTRVIVTELEARLERAFSDEAYHNPKHSKEVSVFVADILKIIKVIDPTLVTERDRVAAEIAAAGHDVVIKFDINQATGQRMRHRGVETGDIPRGVSASMGNEKASAEAVLEILNREDPHAEIYSEQIRFLIQEAIFATFPIVEMKALSQEQATVTSPTSGEAIDLTAYLGKNEDGTPNRNALKFSQKYLTQKSGVAVLSVALGDLSQIGRVSTEQFKESGDAEFREIQQFMSEEIANTDGDMSKVTHDRKAEMAKKMIAWQRDQVGFGLWQKARFAEILTSNEVIAHSPKAPEIREALASAYSQFDENILTCATRSSQTEKTYQTLTTAESYPENDLKFKALVQDMGYLPDR